MPHDHEVEPTGPLTGGAAVDPRGRSVTGAVGEVTGGIIDDAGDFVRAEVIGSGAGDGDHGPGLADRLAETAGRWGHRHRRKLWAAGIVAAVAGLVAAGLTVMRELQGPPLPGVLEPTPAAETDANGSPYNPLSVDWGLPGDGRLGPALQPIGVPLNLIFNGLPSGPHSSAQILGLTGPGLVDSADAAATPLDIPAYGLVAEEKVQATLDCTRIPLPVPTTGLGVRIRVGVGRRTSTGVVPLPKLGARLAPLLTTFCNNWLAQHSLRVNSATFTADPSRPQAAGRITVTNTGTRPVRLSNDGNVTLFFVGIDGEALPVRRTQATVPARGTTTIRVGMQARDCAMGQLPAATPSTFDLLGITATVSLDPPAPDTSAYVAGFAPLGVPLDQETVDRLTALRARLCAGRSGQFLVGPHGPARLDQDGHRLTIPFVVKVPTPGLLGGAVAEGIFPDSPVAPEEPALLTPAGTKLNPDGSGRAVVGTLTFRLPGTSVPCSGDGQPILPLPTLDLQVRSPDGVRTVPIDLTSGYPELLSEAHGVCP